MKRWLILRLEAPLMAFGGVVVDHIGPVRDFPGSSMLAGLIGNALGWDYSDRNSLQSLQDRLVFGARRDREGTRVTDVQNVLLDRMGWGWTTHGAPEGRTGSSYAAPHRRRRDHEADAAVTLVLRLDPAADHPQIEDIAAALDHPARPLFLGRKPCLPSTPLLNPGAARWVHARNVYGALCALPGIGRECRAFWPVGEGPDDPLSGPVTVRDLQDRRNWIRGLHGGSRRAVEGSLPASEAP